ncbi:MAG: ArsR/SmtB family transcription factor [Pseudonocardiaceae bacterium]
MDTFQAVADPVRRRLIESLAAGERSAGQLADLAHAEFGVGQSGTSKHLRALRDSTLVVSRVDGARRIYRLQPQRVGEIAQWAQRQTRFWVDKLDAPEDELNRTDGP